MGDGAGFDALSAESKAGAVQEGLVGEISKRVGWPLLQKGCADEEYC